MSEGFNKGCAQLHRWQLQKTAFYEEFQKFTKTAVHKILHSIQTR